MTSATGKKLDQRSKPSEGKFIERPMAKSRVFVDTSVLITALLSSRGGSFFILHQFKDEVVFQINQYVIDEALRILEEKFSSRPELKNNFFILIGLSRFIVLRNPEPAELNVLSAIINKKDAPILSSALRNSDYLLTLDKDFLNAKTTRFVGRKNLSIINTAEFFEIFQD